MNTHLKKAMRMLADARPPSGFRPATPTEWDKLLRANQEMGYAMYRDNGMTETDARKLAEITHGGPVGRLLLDIAFREDTHDRS